jgi:CBS domain containing-hemolysin-like protein
MVHIRDLIGFMTAQATVAPEANAKRKRPFPAGLNLKTVDLAMPLSATRIVRPILFVPPSLPAMDLLARMQATRIHLALVIDEYGGTDGLVSIEDIVELIVGDIADEHDIEEPLGVSRQADGSFVADARANLEDVAALVGHDFDVREHLSEVDTLGGYLIIKAGHVPVRGELVPGPEGFEIEVLDADPRRVKRARIFRSRDRRARLRDARRREEDAGAARTDTPDEAASGAKL